MDTASFGSKSDGVSQTTEPIAEGIFLVTATVGEDTLHHYCNPPANAPAPEVKRMSAVFSVALFCVACKARYMRHWTEDQWRKS